MKKKTTLVTTKVDANRNEQRVFVVILTRVGFTIGCMHPGESASLRNWEFSW